MATTQSTKLTYAERFWQKVAKADGDACWIWTAAKFPKGYGKVAVEKSRKVDGAHRVAWELTYGSIPIGLSVLHKCDNRPCCRPDHLFIGTQLDNMRDMANKGGYKRRPRQALVLSPEKAAIVARMI